MIAYLIATAAACTVFAGVGFGLSWLFASYAHVPTAVFTSTSIFTVGLLLRASKGPLE